ncbi:S53 family peptidase [Alicyclobacillus sp. SO9]|uniref:S53 family peptidase n=1 Tax=Alicyclobacillus sp. SO9 TaxID=2665646 RepID=UPI0018E84F29|nr:S53 family peptidase [Alicyclobacillus sp. SO9]QQE79318.1 S53 family peptidase [Alicyclobacillus sp. SO9]
MNIRRILFATGEVVPNNGQGYFPNDIKQLYNVPAQLDGTGQTIGILEFSNGYNLRDATQFWNAHNIPTPSVTFVSVDGTRNDGGVRPSDEEATLDLQWAGAMAPAAHIIVYEANGGQTYGEFAAAVTRSLTYILNDTQHHPSVLSISYGDAETSFPSSDIQKWDELIRQLDLKGITVCVSSGDDGAYGLHNPNGPRVKHADAPASVPHAVAVGGTSLQPDGSESAWTYNGPQNGGASGGGFSSIFPLPSAQSGITGTTVNGTSVTPSGRGIPDIACNADPATGYQIIFQSQPAVVGGTSVSSPVFAAIIALANQNRAAQNKTPLSGVGQALYAQNALSSYNDITTGNNSFDGVEGYAATTGWDACTGLGSFDAAKLINYLATL